MEHLSFEVLFRNIYYFHLTYYLKEKQLGKTQILIIISLSKALYLMFNSYWDVEQLFTLSSVSLVAASLYFVVNILRYWLYCEGDLVQHTYIIFIIINIEFFAALPQGMKKKIKKKKSRTAKCILVTAKFTFSFYIYSGITYFIKSLAIFVN